MFLEHGKRENGIHHAKYKKQYFEPKKIHKISLTSKMFNDNISYGTKLNREKLSLIQSGGEKGSMKPRQPR